jgi:hypothetical protein
MYIKPNLEDGEFPSCEKCLYSDEISPNSTRQPECKLLPTSTYTSRTNFCSKGRWKDHNCSACCFHALDFEDAYARWHFVELRKLEEQKEADRLHKILFMKFDNLNLDGLNNGK